MVYAHFTGRRKDVDAATPWRVVTSKKDRRKGEYFLQRGNKFVIKVYADATPDNAAFADWLCKNLNDAEKKKLGLETPNEGQ